MRYLTKLLILPIAFSVCFGAYAQEKKATSLDELLGLISKSKLIESQAANRRTSDFNRQKNQQAKKLSALKSELVKEQNRSERLKKQINNNDLKIDAMEKQLNTALGSLQELFGHLTGAAGDLRDDLNSSLISAQYPNRGAFIDTMVEAIANPSELPNITDIRSVWVNMMQQMVESGKVVRFTDDVVLPNGEVQSKEIIRVGNYNLLADGRYLNFNLDTKRISELVKQPNGLNKVKALKQATSGFTQVGIDPTGPRGGTFLSAIVLTPTQLDQWHQGGYVGYVITVLGVFAILLAIWRLIVLSITSGRIKTQLNSEKANINNPLGRIIKVYEDDKSVDVETLELRLNEAIIKERPPIEAWVNAIKIIAAISPLLGLLGTVTGMILTFQGIMIYGAGDVAGMADGISQALQTTKLGLFAAVPAVLMHTLVNSRATRVIHILDEQAAGIIAQKAEG